MVSAVPLKDSDTEVFSLIQRELERQEFGLEMIPSENFVSEAVLEAMGSVLTNKYAEGRPGRRYYGGCEVVDEVERLAEQRAQQLFGAEFVNVQVHSGATANQAVFEATVNPGDVVMGMKLDHGGHLTHGLKVNFSGRHYEIVAYGVQEDSHLIDYDQVRSLALQHKPKLIICGASAYPRQIDFKLFREIADEVGAVVLADIAHYAGLVATGLYPTPVPHCQLVTTTTHKTLRGPRSGMIMGMKDFEKAVHKAVFPGLQGGPHMHTIAAKAVCFKEALAPDFKVYQQSILDNARTLAAALAEKGFSVISGGTDSHLLLVDVRPLKVTGKDMEQRLDSVGITCNKNTIPFDPQPPTVCSGIRLGTPGLTSRGMGTEEMKIVAELIAQVAAQGDDSDALKKIAQQVRELCEGFPMYRHRMNS